jgi:hypothetical protein
MNQASRHGTGSAGPLADGLPRGRDRRSQAKNCPQGLFFVRLAPLGGSEGRGSKPACAGLDGPRAGCLWQPAGAPASLGAQGQRWPSVKVSSWNSPDRSTSQISK